MIAEIPSLTILLKEMFAELEAIRGRQKETITAQASRSRIPGGRIFVPSGTDVAINRYGGGLNVIEFKGGTAPKFVPLSESLSWAEKANVCEYCHTNNFSHKRICNNCGAGERKDPWANS